MKTLLIILSLLSILTVFSQGNVEYKIHVITPNQEPIPNLFVVGSEVNTRKTANGRTDNNGTVLLKLISGKQWNISIGEIKNCLTVNAVPHSIIEMEEYYIYDLDAHKRKLMQNNKRTDKGFNIINQSFKKTENFPQGKCMVIAKMKNPEGEILSDITVSLVNLKTKTIYRTISDNKGEAILIVPNKSNYDIDINNIINYSYIDFANDYTRRSINIEYAPVIVNEEIINDTTYQKVTRDSKSSSERALVKIHITGGKRNGINEQVYLRELKSNKVYANKSDDKGNVYFLVPTKYVYMVDFNYQKNVDAINLLNAKELTEGSFSVRYSPDPRLEYPETFIPTSKNLILKDFNSFLTTQFEKPTKKPFLFKIKSILKINKDSKEAVFKLTFAGAEENTYGSSVRMPLNLSFVLDKSGSMYSEQRMESLKKSLWELGNALTDDDIVSIVMFDDEAYTALNSHKDHLKHFEKIINSYDPEGGTNIYNGLKLGVQNVAKNFSKKRANKVILLTDGYGVTPPEKITTYVKEKVKSGIDFSTIGLGLDYNQSLLELIAKESNGTFNGIDNSVKLSNVFLEEIKKTFFVVAKDVKIDIIFNKRMIFSKLYGYPIFEENKDKVSFKVNDISILTNEIAFIKFKINNPKKEIENEPLIVKVSYVDVLTNKIVTYSEKVNLEWTEETDTELQLKQEEKKLYAIAILNQSLKLMAEANDNNDVKSAKEALKQGVKQIKKVFPEAKPKEVKALFDEANNYIKLFNQIEKNMD